jgi:hypothetical protein
MERDDLLALCDRYVRGRFAGGESPVRLIVSSYRLGDISESERNSLLAYVSDPEDEDLTDGIEFALDSVETPGICPTTP